MDEFDRIEFEMLWNGIRQNPIEIAKDAYKRGMNISRYLNVLSPSEDEQKLDTFERLMKQAGIITRGEMASNAYDAFFKNGPEGRFLYSEFFARNWRKVSYRAVYLSSDNTVGSWQRPYDEAQTPRVDFQLAPAIPLSELVAFTTPIQGDTFRASYLIYNEEQARMYRVGESADIPLAKLTDRETTVNVYKYARGLQASYEQLRRMRVDKLAFHIQQIAVQAEVDKVETVLDVLINGDGNTNTAAEVVNLTTMDADATPGTLTVEGWLNFEMEWEQPYVMTTALMQRAVALQLRMLTMPTANVPVSTIPLGAAIDNLTPINSTLNGIRYGWTADAPSLKIVAFDRRTAIERFTEIGAEIAEMERFILNQTQIMTMSEVEGYGVIDPEAAKILDVNA